MNFVQIIQTTFEPTFLKILTTGLLFVVFMIGDVYTHLVLSVLMLIIIDTILGVWATYHEGHPITSRRFARVVQKSTVYFLAISAGHFTDMTIGWNVTQSTLIAFIAITELISILENMGRLGYQTPNKLLNQLKDFQLSK